MDLGEGIRKAMAKLSRATIIDAKTIKEFNKELQKTLISSDVDVALVLKLTSSIEQKGPKIESASRDYASRLYNRHSI